MYRDANASVYTISLRMCGMSTFAFKFFKIIYWYAKQSGTWNIFLFLVVCQEFKPPSYECFFCAIFRFLYQPSDSFSIKIRTIATKMYGAVDVSIPPHVNDKLLTYEKKVSWQIFVRTKFRMGYTILWLVFCYHVFGYNFLLSHPHFFKWNFHPIFICVHENKQTKTFS